MTIHRIFRIPLLLAALAAASAAVAELDVSASFEPSRLLRGEQSLYRIEIRETSTAGMPEIERFSGLDVPVPEGLQLISGRQENGQEFQMRGTTTYTRRVSVVYRAIPAGTGNYTIPAFQLTYKGNQLVVPAATLQVSEDPADLRPPVNELVFMEAELPETAYTGETFAVTLTLFVDDTIRLEKLGRPVIQNDALQVGDLPDEPQRGRVTRGTRSFSTLSWTFKATPLRPGTATATFEVRMLAMLPDSRRVRRPSLVDTLFNTGSFRSQEFTVYTDDSNLTVRPLPAEGKPDPFGGAIGTFTLETEPPPQVAEVGEPVLIKARITGSGNFDRIQAPVLEAGAGWKVYEPDRQFEPADPIGLSGTLTLDYVVIPQERGEQNLPPLSFTFLDPDTGRYVELEGGSAQLAVAGGSGGNTAASGRTVPATALATAARDPLAEQLRIDPRKIAGRIPGPAVLFNPLFVSLQLLLGTAVVAGAWRLRHQRRLREEPAYAHRQQIRGRLKSALAKVERAGGDPAALAAAGQEAVRAQAELRSGTPLRSATAAEIEHALGDLAAPAREALHALFEHGDAHRFAGPGRGSGLSAAELRGRVDTVLKALS